MIKRILIGLAIILVALQFFQPPRNSGEVIQNGDISHVYGLPEAVHQVFIQKCYDCHSNNTRYPWYTSIQPIGWWMNRHINHGKEHLNFSEFASYTDSRAKHKLEEIGEVITEGEMPLKSYLLIHRDAAILQNEAAMIVNWVRSMGIEIKQNSHEH